MTGNPPLDPVRWDDTVPAVRIIDQRKLPGELVYWPCRTVEEVAEYHGYPTVRVSARVLRQFRDQGMISNAEYRALVKRLG